MSSDSLESKIDNSPVDETPSSHPPNQNSDEYYIDGVETFPQGTAFRDSLATQMYNDWLVARGKGGNP